VFGGTIYALSLSDAGRYIPVTGASVVGNESNHRASWSPDGARVAFTSIRNGRRDIYTANADGSGLVAVTAALPAGSSDPAWSW
jgi:Tol biopolymer transport system component